MSLAYYLLMIEDNTDEGKCMVAVHFNIISWGRRAHTASGLVVGAMGIVRASNGFLGIPR